MEPGPRAEEHVREGRGGAVQWDAEIAGGVEDEVAEGDIVRREISAEGKSAGECGVGEAGTSPIGTKHRWSHVRPRGRPGWSRIHIEASVP